MTKLLRLLLRLLRPNTRYIRVRPDNSWPQVDRTLDSVTRFKKEMGR